MEGTFLFEEDDVIEDVYQRPISGARKFDNILCSQLTRLRKNDQFDFPCRKKFSEEQTQTENKKNADGHESFFPHILQLKDLAGNLLDILESVKTRMNIDSSGLSNQKLIQEVCKKLADIESELKNKEIESLGENMKVKRQTLATTQADVSNTVSQTTEREVLMLHLKDLLKIATYIGALQGHTVFDVTNIQQVIQKITADLQRLDSSDVTNKARADKTSSSINTAVQTGSSDQDNIGYYLKDVMNQEQGKDKHHINTDQLDVIYTAERPGLHDGKYAESKKKETGSTNQGKQQNNHPIDHSPKELLKHSTYSIPQKLVSSTEDGKHERSNWNKQGRLVNDSVVRSKEKYDSAGCVGDYIEEYENGSLNSITTDTIGSDREQHKLYVPSNNNKEDPIRDDRIQEFTRKENSSPGISLKTFDHLNCPSMFRGGDMNGPQQRMEERSTTPFVRSEDLRDSCWERNYDSRRKQEKKPTESVESTYYSEKAEYLYDDNNDTVNEPQDQHRVQIQRDDESSRIQDNQTDERQKEILNDKTRQITLENGNAETILKSRFHFGDDTKDEMQETHDREGGPPLPEKYIKPFASKSDTSVVQRGKFRRYKSLIDANSDTTQETISKDSRKRNIVMQIMIASCVAGSILAVVNAFGTGPSCQLYIASLLEDLEDALDLHHIGSPVS